MSKKHDDVANPMNRFVETKVVQNALKKCKLKGKVKYLHLFQLASTDSSYLLNNYRSDKAVNMVPFQKNDNRRLACLGEKIFENHAMEYVYIRFVKQNHTMLSKIYEDVVHKTRVLKYLQHLELDPYVLITRSMEKTKGRQNVDVMKYAFYAYIACFYMDLGNEKTKHIVHILIEDCIDFQTLMVKLHAN